MKLGLDTLPSFPIEHIAVPTTRYALVYLQGDQGSLCLAFHSKACADTFVVSINLKDLADNDNMESVSGISLDDEYSDDGSSGTELDVSSSCLDL